MTALLSKLFLAISKNKKLRNWVSNSRLGRRAVRQFIPGESPTDAFRAAEEFAKQGLTSVFTYLGENVTTAQDALNVREHYLNILHDAAELNADAEISVKLTHLGLDLDEELAAESLAQLAECADETNSYLWIDMEESNYVERTLRLYHALNPQFDNIGICLQAYLRRTESDLRELLQTGGGIRLVKGAYREPPNVAFADKDKVDENYRRLARAMLKAGTGDGRRPAFATHDHRLIRGVQNDAQDAGIEQDQYEFQMLYGIRERLQQRLASDGYQVRVLISYGDAWYSWYMRRLAERPANAVFAVRNILAA